MQQAHGITSILILATFTTILPSTATSASSPKPVEVKSDPYGQGHPTKYSILKGNSRVTFSHPLAGQFTRAEIVTREKTGNRLTRFLLSTDRNAYRPVLSFLIPFEIHYSKKDDKLCVGEPTPLQTMSTIAPKALDGQLIAEKRAELTKEKFFDSSCFDPSIPEAHRNAILNAASDVLSTKTQDVTPEPKFLRCMEKFGFAHEAGTILALKKVSKVDPKNECKIRLACTTDDNAEPASFNEKTCLVTLQTTTLPDRDDYASRVFHELAHSVPMRDGVPIELLQDCCGEAKRCDVLKAVAERTQNGERKEVLLETLNQKNSVLTSQMTILTGNDADAAALIPKSDAILLAEKVTLSRQHPTFACQFLGKQTCATDLASAALDADDLINACKGKTYSAHNEQNSLHNIAIANLILNASAAEKPKKQVKCEAIETGFTNRNTTEAAMASSRPAQEIQVIESLPQTSPITWEIPKEPATPIHLASSLPADDTPQPGQGSSIGHTPTRTIASIEPLPDEAPTRSLGSASNRKDVSAGRATVLVDTVERAARKVTQTLTPEKVELLQVDRKEIFDADYKPKTKSPQYFVTSSATKPIQVADIGDIQGLSFPNPFASSLPKVGPEQKLAKGAPGTDAKSKFAKASGSIGTVTEKDGSADSEGGASLTAAALHTSRATTNASAFVADSREPSGTASTTHDFKSMDRTALIKFLTSGFRTVSLELENPNLAKALVDNRIQVHDHENRQIGSMKPETTFIYSSELGRLVQTRVNREKK